MRDKTRSRATIASGTRGALWVSEVAAGAFSPPGALAAPHYHYFASLWQEQISIGVSGDRPHEKPARPADALG
jgi:hypothetical protein